MPARKEPKYNKHDQTSYSTVEPNQVSGQLDKQTATQTALSEARQGTDGQRHGRNKINLDTGTASLHQISAPRLRLESLLDSHFFSTRSPI